jgi:mannose-6-phosphate isomerase-like protein (cupin superfamily)
MPRGKHLVIVNPLKEQAPLDHRDKQSGRRIALHWDGVGPSQGAEQAWVSLIQIGPGDESTLHIHPEQEEFFIVVEGSGVIRELVKGKLVAHALERYDIVLAPKGTAKQIRNTGTEPMVLIQVYAPIPQARRIQDIVSDHEIAVHLDDRS